MSADKVKIGSLPKNLLILGKLIFAFLRLRSILGGLPLVFSTIVYPFFFFCIVPSNLEAYHDLEEHIREKLYLETSFHVGLYQSFLVLNQWNSNVSFLF